MNDLPQNPQSNIGVVIASFLSEKAKQYGIEQNKLLIDSNYGERAKDYTQLEECPF